MNFLKSVKRQSFNRSQRKKARNGLYGHVYGPYESLPENIFRYETLYAPNGKHYSQSKTPTVFFRKKSGRIKRLVKYKPIWAAISVKKLSVNNISKDACSDFHRLFSNILALMFCVLLQKIRNIKVLLNQGLKV